MNTSGVVKLWQGFSLSRGLPGHTIAWFDALWVPQSDGTRRWQRSLWSHTYLRFLHADEAEEVGQSDTRGCTVRPYQEIRDNLAAGKIIRLYEHPLVYPQEQLQAVYRKASRLEGAGYDIRQIAGLLAWFEHLHFMPSRPTRMEAAPPLWLWDMDENPFHLCSEYTQRALWADGDGMIDANDGWAYTASSSPHSQYLRWKSEKKQISGATGALACPDLPCSPSVTPAAAFF